VKLQIDQSGHCEVLSSTAAEESTRTGTTDCVARSDDAYETPSRPVMPPDNFETPPPEALRLNKLEDFQVKQKIIEEQNRFVAYLALAITGI
jgi:hypothetical protein